MIFPPQTLELRKLTAAHSAGQLHVRIHVGTGESESRDETQSGEHEVQRLKAKVSQAHSEIVYLREEIANRNQQIEELQETISKK